MRWERLYEIYANNSAKYKHSGDSLTIGKISSTILLIVLHQRSVQWSSKQTLITTMFPKAGKT